MNRIKKIFSEVPILKSTELVPSIIKEELNGPELPTLGSELSATTKELLNDTSEN